MYLSLKIIEHLFTETNICVFLQTNTTQIAHKCNLTNI